MVVGPVSCECMDVIHEVASEKAQLCKAFGEAFFLIEDSYQDSSLTISLKQLALKELQKENASVAIERSKHGWRQREEVCRLSSSKQLSVVSWPGRMEVLQDTPLIINDGAHNLPAIERLIQNMTKRFEKKQTPYLVRLLERMIS